MDVLLVLLLKLIKNKIKIVKVVVWILLLIEFGEDFINIKIFMIILVGLFSVVILIVWRFVFFVVVDWNSE